MSRSCWYAMDTGFLSDPAIVELRCEFGAAGPLAVVALLSEAKLQNDGGQVTVGHRTLTEAAALDSRDQTDALLDRLEEFGVLRAVTKTSLSVTVAFAEWEKMAKRPPESSNERRTATAPPS